MLSNLTPVKKLVLGLAAMCIVVSVITANNLSSVMMLIAARNNSQNANTPVVQQQQAAPQQNVQANNNTSNNTSNNTNTNTNTNTSTDANKPSTDANKPAADANTPADDANKGGEKSVAEIADISPICSIMVARAIGIIVIIAVINLEASKLSNNARTVMSLLIGIPIQSAFATMEKSTSFIKIPTM